MLKGMSRSIVEEVFVRRIIVSSLALLLLCTQVAWGQALPPRSLFQAMLDGNKASGWIAFRNFNGRQLLYFTTLQTLHCRLKEIRYSINNEDLDQRVELVKCNPAMPFSVGESDVLEGRIYISMPLGTAFWAAVQVGWEDETVSEVQRVKVCEGVGEATCGIVD